MTAELDYEEYVQIIKGIPTSFFPALLSIMVQAAYEKNVFVPGGASSFVRNVEVHEAHKSSDLLQDADIANGRNIGDAVMLIVRLCRRLESTDPVRERAMDWLVRKNLVPSVLREVLPQTDSRPG